MDEQLQFCMHVITMTTSFSKLFLNWNQRRRERGGEGGRGNEKKNHSRKEINRFTKAIPD